MFDCIHLASQSPRRAQLLAQIGVRHVPLLPGADEDAEGLEAVRPGEPPEVYVARVTQAKLAAALMRRVQRGAADWPVLCADTTVALDGAILGKPADAAEALAMLTRLAGRSHQVHTAVAVGQGGRVLARTQTSTVRMSDPGAARLAAYAASGEPMGKAGSYAIQSAAAAWIMEIHGSYSGIMGLPLYDTAELLAAFDVVVGAGHA
ncbi:MAG: Maf family nucleotide pyrophosphatase [Proteobacteria bacterium]|nr:Maf family nucleotide pyrophosphatase [Pseudomonadota bacterium]